MHTDSSIEIVGGDPLVTSWLLVMPFPRVRWADSKECMKERYFIITGLTARNEAEQLSTGKTGLWETDKN